MKIFLDADDTLNEFTEYAVAHGAPRWEGSWYTTPRDTWSDEQKATQDAVSVIMEREDFWNNIPVAPRAFELIAAAASRGDVHLLTALPRSVRPEFLPRIEIQKREWGVSHLHFSPGRIIVCERHEKARYATGEWGYAEIKHLLVDDAEQNCREWAAAGGGVIHHTDMNTSIAALKKL